MSSNGFKVAERPLPDSVKTVVKEFMETPLGYFPDTLDIVEEYYWRLSSRSIKNSWSVDEEEYQFLTMVEEKTKINATNALLYINRRRIDLASRGNGKVGKNTKGGGYMQMIESDYKNQSTSSEALANTNGSATLATPLASSLMSSSSSTLHPRSRHVLIPDHIDRSHSINRSIPAELSTLGSVSASSPNFTASFPEEIVNVAPGATPSYITPEILHSFPAGVFSATIEQQQQQYQQEQEAQQQYQQYKQEQEAQQQQYQQYQQEQEAQQQQYQQYQQEQEAQQYQQEQEAQQYRQEQEAQQRQIYQQEAQQEYEQKQQQKRQAFYSQYWKSQEEYQRQFHLHQQQQQQEQMLSEKQKMIQQQYQWTDQQFYEHTFVDENGNIQIIPQSQTIDHNGVTFIFTQEDISQTERKAKVEDGGVELVEESHLDSNSSSTSSPTPIPPPLPSSKPPPMPLTLPPPLEVVQYSEEEKEEEKEKEQQSKPQQNEGPLSLPIQEEDLESIKSTSTVNSISEGYSQEAIRSGPLVKHLFEMN